MKYNIIMAIWISVFMVLIGISFSAAIAPVTKAVSSEKKQYLKTVVTDSVKIAVVETLLVIKHDTVKVTNLLKDTTKQVKSDTTHGVKYDTLRIKKK